jgi:hypothetical protein
MKQLNHALKISLIIAVIVSILILMLYNYLQALWFLLGYLVAYLNFKLILKSAKSKHGYWMVVFNSTIRILIYGIILFIGYLIEKEVITLILIALGIVTIKVSMIVSFIIHQKEEIR